MDFSTIVYTLYLPIWVGRFLNIYHMFGDYMSIKSIPKKKDISINLLAI